MERHQSSVNYRRCRRDKKHALCEGQTLVKPRVLLRGFLFVLRALIYFAIFAELVLLVYVLEAIA